MIPVWERTTTRLPRFSELLHPYLLSRLHMAMLGIHSTKFVVSLRNAARSIRSAIYVLPSIPFYSRPLPVKRWNASTNPSRMRLFVLHRDHYRCLSCGEGGDEVTLEVRRIQPAASKTEEMLTLCAHCRNVAGQSGISAMQAPEFLRLLRCQLHCAA
jgi:hypothetical protein